MYKNISTKRLRAFYSEVYNIETRAFGNNKKLFERCHALNRRLWDIIQDRGNK